MGYLLFYILLGLQIVPPDDAWCDVVFKDVAREAEVVLITRARLPKGEGAELTVVEVLKGEFAELVLRVDAEALRERGIRADDHVLLALGKDGKLVARSKGMGACLPVSLVRLRGEKLRGRDRADYDSQQGPMELDEVRQDLTRQLR